MENLRNQEAPGLTRGEIFDLYCRLLALEERLREIDALASDPRQPLGESFGDMITDPRQRTC